MFKQSFIFEPTKSRLISLTLILIFNLSLSFIYSQSSYPLFPKVLKTGNCLEVIAEFKKDDSIVSDSTISTWLETLYLITPSIDIKYFSYEKLYRYFKKTEHVCTLKRFEPVLIQY